ncbi:MAG: hypothetical protein ACJ754_23560 [Pyrinomonadaceae bacterium]
MKVTPQAADSVYHETHFWPPRPVHTLSSLDIWPERHLAPHLRHTAPLLQELSTLANVIREIQSKFSYKGTSASVADYLRASADIIEEIGGAVRGGTDKGALFTRSKALRGEAATDDEGVIRKLHGHIEEELFLFCGSLKTWHAKSKQRFHSFVAAVPDPRWNSLVGKIGDATALEVFRRALGDGNLTMPDAPLYGIFNIIACGGEANRYPKHFCYFFPEDEGTPSSPVNRTVVFQNLYVHRFLYSSLPRLRRFVAGCAGLNLDEETAAKALIMWLKGHDIGHSVRLPETDMLMLHTALDEFSAGILEETAADCYGYLLLTSDEVSRATGLSHEFASLCFVGEMLRYLSRGRKKFQDSDAALLELSYLLRHGYAEIDGPCLSLTSAGLHEGMLRLTEELNRQVLSGDPDKVRLFAETHMNPAEPSMAAAEKFVGAMQEHSADIPLCTSYIFQPGGGNGVPIAQR